MTEWKNRIRKSDWYLGVSDKCSESLVSCLCWTHGHEYARPVDVPVFLIAQKL